MQKKMGGIIAGAEGMINRKTVAAYAVVGMTPLLMDHEGTVWALRCHAGYSV